MQRNGATGLQGAVYRADVSAEERRRADKTVNRENHLSLIYAAGGGFILRVHDEITEGGRRLEMEAQVNLPPYATAVITDGVLPTSVPEGTDVVILDFDLTATGDVNITGWAPQGLADRAHLRLRKVDSSTGRLLYTDEFGMDYHLVDRKTEFMSFIWLADPGQLLLI